MNQIFVVNKYKHTPTDNDIYIGRGSSLGNPYSHLKSKFDDVIKVATREEAIEKYRQLLYNSSQGDTKLWKSITYILERLSKNDVYLVCFCAPKPCHGHVIKEFIDELRQTPK